MSDPLVDTKARLEQLLAQTLKETDPAKYDELGAEICRVLVERERIKSQPPSPDKTEQ